MSHWARLLTLLACLGFVLPAFSGEAQWVEIHSPHFSVITDAGEKHGRDVAVRFEQMRAVFGSLMARAKVSTPVPLQIVAFRSTKELLQYAPLFQGKPTKLAGLFQGNSDRTFIMLDMSVEDPWQVVFHEYAHQLMNGTMEIQLDPWFEEGFAEYFRSITVDGKEANIGKIPEDEYYVLDHSGWLKIQDLLRVRQNTRTYNENGDHRTVFYAESGILVHYLYDNSLILKAGDYFNLVANKHLSVEDAIQQAFGMSPAQFDKTLHSYESSGRFKYYKLPAPAGIDGKTYSSAPLGTNDAQAILADIHLHSVDYQDAARQEFEAVIQSDPNNAAALRGLGYSYLIKQDYAKAGEYFHRASKINSNDARVLYYSAMLSQREPPGESVDPERLTVMQGELEKSIELDPDFADAYNILSFTYMSEGKVDKAMIALRRAIELNPREEQYRFNMANLYIENKQFDDAQAVLGTMRASENPQTQARLEQELANLQRYREELRYEEKGSPVDVSGAALVNRSSSPEPDPEPASPVISAAARFMHGKLISVDCSSPPAAVLSVVSGGKTWKMRVANSKNAIIIGADEVSCDWKNQSVAVNYRDQGDGQGDVISLEIQ